MVVDAPEETVDRLYGLPLDEFTAERDAAAQELRRDGDREAADAVRKLRKPSAPAWALNQLARRRSDEVKRLIAAGDELRDAQENVYKGGGARDRLRGAVEAEREAVGSLLGEARELLDAEGRKPSQQVLDRARDTLHAAATDERVRDELSAGRLVEHAEPVGLGPAPAGAPSRRKPKRETEEARRQEALAEARRRVREAEREAKAAERRAEKARQEAEAAAADVERRRDELARLEEHSG